MLVGDGRAPIDGEWSAKTKLAIQTELLEALRQVPRGICAGEMAIRSALEAIEFPLSYGANLALGCIETRQPEEYQSICPSHQLRWGVLAGKKAGFCYFVGLHRAEDPRYEPSSTPKEPAWP